jgi:hypothetical protein
MVNLFFFNGQILFYNYKIGQMQWQEKKRAILMQIYQWKATQGCPLAVTYCTHTRDED